MARPEQPEPMKDAAKRGAETGLLLSTPFLSGGNLAPLIIGPTLGAGINVVRNAAQHIRYSNWRANLPAARNARRHLNDKQKWGN